MVDVFEQDEKNLNEQQAFTEDAATDQHLQSPGAGTQGVKKRRLDSVNGFIDDALRRNRFEDEGKSRADIARDLLDDIAREDVVRMNTSLEEGKKISPEVGIRISKLQSRTGLPLGVIEANFAQLEADESIRSATDLIRNGAPGVADFVRQSKFYSSFTDPEIFGLSTLERMLKTPRGLWRRPDDAVIEASKRWSNLEHSRRIDELRASKIGVSLERMRELDSAEAAGRVKRREEAQARGEFYFETDINSLLGVGDIITVPTEEQLFRDRLHLLREEEEYIARSTQIGFGEAWSQRSRENPDNLIMFLAGIQDTARYSALWRATKAKLEGSETELQDEMLIRYGRLAAAAEFRGTDVFGKTAEIMSGIPSVVGEFVATGPAFFAAKTFILKGGEVAAKGLLKRAVQKALSARVVKNSISATVLASGFQSIFSGPQRTIGNVFQRITPRGQVVNIPGEGLGYHVSPGTEQSLFVAVPSAIAKEWIEVFTERVGVVVDRAITTPVMRSLTGALNKSRAKKGLPAFAPRPGYEFLKSAFEVGGVHSVLGEISEEELSSMLQGFTGVGPSYSIPFTAGGTTGEELLAQMMAFGVLPLGRAAIGVFGPKERPNKTNTETLRRMADTVQGSNAYQKAPEVMEPLTQRMSDGTDQATVSIPFEVLTEFSQEGIDPESKPVNPESFAEELGVKPNEYKQAKDTGSPLQVDMAKFNTVVNRDKKTADFFRERVNNDAMEMTAKEHQEFAKEDLVRETGVQSELDFSVERAINVVRDQLEATGEAIENIEPKLKLWEGFLRTTVGKRTNVSPFDLLQQMGLIIRREGVSPQKAPLAGEVPPAAPPVVEVPEKPAVFRASPETGITSNFVPTQEQAKNGLATIGDKPVTITTIDPISGEQVASVQLDKPSAEEVVQALRDTLVEKSGVAPEAQVSEEVEQEQESREAKQAEQARKDTIKSDKENFQFEQARKGDPRGSLAFGPDRTMFILNLFRAADLTTFLHESGHFFLEVMSDLAARDTTDQSLKDDYRGILDFFERQNVEKVFSEIKKRTRIAQARAKKNPNNPIAQQASRDFTEALELVERQGGAKFMRRVAETGGMIIEDFPIRHAVMTPYHELWAKTFEVYLATGEAPTVELQPAFARMKAWMLWAYGQLKTMMRTLGVTLPEDVRDIMDRMLATQEEIDIAQASFGLTDRFDSGLRRIGLAEDEVQSILRGVKEWKAESSEQMTLEVTKQLEREKQAIFREKVSKREAEILEELNRDKTHIALAVLDRGTFPDGSPLPEGMDASKLNREELIELRGEEILAALPRTLHSAKGIELKEAADHFGFDGSVDKLVDALVEVMERHRQLDPSFEKDGEKRERLNLLRQKQKQLEAVKDQIQPKTAKEKKTLKKDQAKRQKAIEVNLMEQERVFIFETEFPLEQIKTRGGIRFKTEAEAAAVPAEFRATKKTGVPVEVLAQEAFAQNLIKQPTPSTVAAWVNDSIRKVEESEQRVKEIPKTAGLLARQQTAASVSALIENTQEQSALTFEIREIREERVKLEKGLAGRVLKDTAKREAEDQIRSEAGDILDDPSLIEKAQEIVHNDKRRTLNRRIFQTMLKAAKGRGFFRRLRKLPRTEDLKAKARSDIAKRAVLGTTARAFHSAEIRAARLFESRLHRGDLETAIQAKWGEIINHEYYLAATEALKVSDKQVKNIRDTRKKSVLKRVGNADQEALGQLNKLHKDYEFVRVSNRELDYRSRRTSDEDVEPTGTLDGYVDQLGDESRPHSISVDIVHRETEGRQVNFRELTFEELTGLHDTIMSLVNVALKKNTAIVEQQEIEMQERETLLDRTIRERARPISQGPTNAVREIWDSVKKFGSALKGVFILPEVIIREVDGFEDLGPVFMNTKAVIDTAVVTKLLPFQEKAAEGIQEIYQKFYTLKEWRDIRSRKVYIPEINANLTKENMIGIGWYQGTATSRAAVLESRNLWGLDRNPPTQEEVDLVLSEKYLQKKDWDFIQAVWKFNDGFFPEINQAHIRRTGLPLPKLEHIPVNTPFGVIPGGFMTHKFDVTKSARAKEVAEDELRRLSMGRYGAAAVQGGFMKERVGTGGQAVRLDFGVWEHHIRDVGYNLSMGDAVNYVSRILKSKTVQRAFVDTGQRQSLEALELWLRDAATGEVIGTDALSRISRHLRVGLSASSLGWNMSTGLVQFTGWAQTVTLLGPKYANLGLKDLLSGDWRGENSIYAQVIEDSDFMKSRSQGSFQKEIIDAQRVMKKWTFIPEGLRSSYFYLIIKAQQVVDMASWLGAFRKGLDKFGDKQKAVQFADGLVRRAQASGIWTDRTAIERGTLSRNVQQVEFVRSFTAFTSYFLAKASNAYERTAVADFKSPKGVATWAWDMGLMFTVEAMAVALIRGNWPDSDDPEADSFSWFMAKESLKTAFGTLPLLRDFAGEVQGFRGGGVWGTAAYRFAGAWNQVQQGEVDLAAIKGVNNFLGLMLHYPSVQTNRVMDAWWRETLNEEDVNFMEYLVGRPRRR